MLSIPTASTAFNHVVRRAFNKSRMVSSLKSPDNADIQALKNLDDTSVVLDQELLAGRNTDWRRQYTGRSKVLVIPDTVGAVSEVLKYCNQQKIGVVPQGGNTGLVGGSVPVHDEIILSTERLNGIHELNPLSGILKCGAGCILSDLQAYATTQKHLVPIDLGSKGTCQIGGNISTNAGGQYFFRYKSLAANVLGLQVVLADGKILDLNFSRTNLKDNTGYKLHQIFIGAEGTLGVVTAASILCPRLPLSRQAAFLACDTFRQVLDVMQSAQDELGETLAAVEWMDEAVMKVVSRQTPIPLPGNDSHAHYILVETHGCNRDHDIAKLEAFFDRIVSNGDVSDGVVAQSLGQVEQFWLVRESCNPAVAAQGFGYKYDVSLPVDCFDDFCRKMDSRLTGRATSTNWGHIADGNLHFNTTKIGRDKVDTELLHALEPFIFETVMSYGGSISAEHGLGQAKNKYLSMIHDQNELSSMRDLKNLFDPAGILNPGKFLPE